MGKIRGRMAPCGARRIRGRKSGGAGAKDFQRKTPRGAAEVSRRRKPALISNMPSLHVRAFAKVNLRLDVLARRADGYHELRTIFQSISLHDTLQLELSRNPGLELTVRGDSALAAGPQRENLVWRAAEAFRRDVKLPGGIAITLKKRVPAGRGLGGGSSDAAATLAGLVRLTKRRIAPERLLEIAAGLGADVPFFLGGGRALGTGR